MDKALHEKYIERIANLFPCPSGSEMITEMKKAGNIQDKSVKKIIKKYSNVQIDEKVAKQIIYDIISQLITKREDFYVLIKIYLNITSSEIDVQALRKCCILNNNNVKKVENGISNIDIKENGDNIENNYIKFGVDLACLYNDEHFYHYFVKGLLLYLRSTLEKLYLSQYVKTEFFDNLDKSSYYFNNLPDLYNSLLTMLNDMNRVIATKAKRVEEKKKNLNNKIVEKIPRNKYRLFVVLSKLQKREDILNIYDDCQNDNEIAFKINSLCEKDENNCDLLGLKVKIDDYIENEKIKLELQELHNYREKHTQDREEIYHMNKELQDCKNEIKKLDEKVEKQNEGIVRLNNEVTALKGKNTLLEKKVTFMEPVVKSLISRKVINFLMIKILEKYKNKINVTQKYNKYGKKVYKITFIDTVNNIGVVQSNSLIDNLFDEKDVYNEDSHLVGKNVPDFYKNIWSVVKEKLKLNENELIAFDAIFDDNIKSEFKFDAEDISVSDYLYGKNLSEFGIKNT